MNISSLFYEKRYTISEVYNLKSIEGFKNFSNEILHRKSNRIFYRKRQIYISIFYLLSFLIIAWTIGVMIIGSRIERHSGLFIGLTVSTAIIGFIPTIYLSILFTRSGGPIAIVNAPTRDGPIWMSRGWHKDWTRIFEWCYPCMFEVGILQILSIMNTIKHDDFEYVFTQGMKRNNVQYNQKMVVW